jgi:hypothetical protein
MTAVGAFSAAVNAGKYDGVSLGASVGGNLASLKEASVNDGFSRFGANGKIFGGMCKSLADVLFVGVEVYGRYSFFMKTEENTKGDVEGAPQFGGYLKAGLRPSESLLIYGVYGVQGSYTKIKNARAERCLSLPIVGGQRSLVVALSMLWVWVLLCA